MTVDSASSENVKKPLQRSKSAANVSSNAQPRKRAALGDVSNVNKTETVDGKDAKKASSKPGLLSKAAQPTKVQKLSRSNSTRTTLGPKDKNAGAADLKRPASGSGVTGHKDKRRNTSSSGKESIKEEDEDETQNGENVAPRSNKSGTVTIEVQKTVKSVKEIKEVKEKREPEPELEPEQEEDEDRVLPPDVPDLDAEDVDDPLMVAEYVNEIFDYLLKLEIATLPNANYMDNQPELEWKMRGILVDWLLEVHTRFRLLPETLFLAVNIIDRFLSCKVVQLDRLQLVGVTAMFIASKYEEVLSPHVQNFRHVADDGFTEEEILSAERFVLAALDYDLSYPNPMNFLRRISKADNYDIQTRTIGKYLLEISCLDHRFLAHPPSQVAAAAMYLARMVLDRGDWVSLYLPSLL